MRIGYACITLGAPDISYRSCIQKNATPERLFELIRHNLAALEGAIDYNRANNIRLFRITSDLIPFGSSPVNTLDWADRFADSFQVIGQKIRDSGMRVSMHPGQYTVLNSPDEGVVLRAIDDLAYHARILDACGLNSTHKIILHIGGVYLDKPAAILRFRTRFKALSEHIRKRLVIENDDRNYTIDDVFTIGRDLHIPVVFDNLHHAIYHRQNSPDSSVWVRRCRTTWQTADGPQKIHYSQQDPAKRPGSHTQTIAVRPFLDFCSRLDTDDLDIMLEVKDKNLSALKCQLCQDQNSKRASLEREWARYKYSVLERSPSDYYAIRAVLRDDSGLPSLQVFSLIEQALASDVSPEHAQNAAQHVWGYFKAVASDREKNAFLAGLEAYMAGEKKLSFVKRQLKRLTDKYREPYLLDSYYFIH